MFKKIFSKFKNENKIVLKPRILNIKENDIIIIKVNFLVSEKVLNNIKNGIKNMLGDDKKIIILEKDVDIEMILRKIN